MAIWYPLLRFASHSSKPLLSILPAGKSDLVSKLSFDFILETGDLHETAAKHGWLFCFVLFLTFYLDCKHWTASGRRKKKWDCTAAMCSDGEIESETWRMDLGTGRDVLHSQLPRPVASVKFSANTENRRHNEEGTCWTQDGDKN